MFLFKDGHNCTISMTTERTSSSDEGHEMQLIALEEMEKVDIEWRFFPYIHL